MPSELPPDLTLTLISASARSGVGAHKSAPPYLLIIEGGSSSIHALPESGELVIGRGEEADVRLSERAVSRQHARLHLRDGSVFIEDLGSHNGTRIHSERISGMRELHSGDVIVICGISLLFARPPGSSARRPIHDNPMPLRRRLEEEIERVAQTHRAVSLVALHVGKLSLPRRMQLCAALGRTLRILDTVAWEGATLLWILLPEVDEAAATELAARMVSAVATTCPEARAGTATCPADGYELGALWAGARAAMESAPAAAVRSAATTVTTLQIGDRVVLIADPAMVRLYELIDRLAPSELPVLIFGETGTGKELAAQALHARGKRAAGPLIIINCAALPESLAESELFGHEKGAFSGAVAAKTGFIEAANHGVLFLDEVGELTLPIQAKLLRVLEQKKLIRVGEVRERAVDVRIIAATHRDLEGEVKKGRFREDLFFRLNSAVLHLPPLRDRPRELPLLARGFLAEACVRAARPQLVLAPATLDLLLRHSWPGNVRELRNAMDYAAMLATEQLVEPEHLPKSLLANLTKDAPAPAASAQLQEVAPPTAAEQSSLSSTARSILRLHVANKLEAIEAMLIQEALVLTGGNKTAAARLLGVHRKYIERRADKPSDSK